MGWDFIGLIDTGRYKEYRDDSPVGSSEQRITEQFWAECKGIAFETLPGPNRMMTWAAAGKGHDDLVMSAAMVTQLEGLDWRKRVARGVA